MVAQESAQSELAAIVGSAHIDADQAACQAAAVDGVVPKCVVSPQSAEEVAAVLKCAADHDRAVIPFRNCTKLEIGNRPKRYDIGLSLKVLNRVWYYEPDDLTMTVEPGIKLGDLQRLLARHRLWLPLDPPGGEGASLGGILAANASGPLRLSYGTARDMVVGMKIATADGKLVSTGGRVVKNVAGYDLSKLLIGSFGTLGVIVGINLKLFPLPDGMKTFALCVPTLDMARDLRRKIVHSALTPIRMVYVDCSGGLQPSTGQGLQIAAPSDKPFLLMQAAGSKRVLERYSSTLNELTSVTGTRLEDVDDTQAANVWEWVSDFRLRVAAKVSDALVMRTSVLMSSAEDFVAAVKGECERAQFGADLVVQSGSGVVQVCVHGFDSDEPAVKLVEQLRKAAMAQQGALLVERCRAELKDRLDVWGLPGDACQIMRELKKAWDPKGTLAPGRFVGGI